MTEIFFKASRKASSSCDGYREIIKRGTPEDLKEDLLDTSDDGIIIFTQDINRIGIDCDKKTGEFRLFFKRNN